MGEMQREPQPLGRENIPFDLTRIFLSEKVYTSAFFIGKAA